MAASVRIEDEAFSDIRFNVLATACLLADADHARGKMAVLWRQCTAMGSYVLPPSVIAAVLGASGVAALIESHLGEAVDGGIRVRGTRGRIEWLKKLRKNAQKGGRAKAAKRQTRGRQEAAKSLPPPCPPAPIPALTPSPIPVQEAGVVTRAPRSTGKVPISADWKPRDQERAKAAELGLNPEHEAEEFHAYWMGTGRAMKNWDLTFRSRLLQQAKRGAFRPRNTNTGRAEPLPAEAYEADKERAF